MNFSSLQTKYKVMLAAAAIVFAVILFFKLVFMPILAFGHSQSEKAADLKKNTGYIDELLEKRDSLNKEYAEILGQITDISEAEKNKNTNVTKMLDWFGLKANDYSLDVISFNELQNGSSDPRIKETVLNWEIRGTMPRLQGFCSELDNLGIKYSIGSISLRIDESYDFLGRYYDTVTCIPWYSNPLDEQPEPEKHEQSPSVTVSPQPEQDTPVQTPEPQPVQPLPSQNTPEPANEPEKPAAAKTPSINDRLNELLQKTHFINGEKYRAIKIPAIMNKNYTAKFIVDTKDYSQGNYRLRMTVKFFSYVNAEEAA